MSGILMNREKKKPTDVIISIKSNQPQEYMDIQIRKEIIKIQESELEYRIDTARVILENLLFPGKRKKLKTGKTYRVNAAIGKQAKEAITKLLYAQKQNQIISLWFEHKILQLSIDGPHSSYSFVYYAPSFMDSCPKDKDAFYEYSISLGENKVQQFWISAEVLQAWRLDTPLSAVLGSNKYLRCQKDYREPYFFNTFWFYLWTKPSLIDTPRLFNPVITFLDASPYFFGKRFAPDIAMFSINLNIWKELLRRKRPDLFTVGLLVLPRVFAQSI